MPDSIIFLAGCVVGGLVLTFIVLAAAGKREPDPTADVPWAGDDMDTQTVQELYGPPDWQAPYRWAEEVE